MSYDGSLSRLPDNKAQYRTAVPADHSEPGVSCLRPRAIVSAMWSDVLAFLETARFVDLLLPGWIDRDGPVPVCHPLTFDACLQAESGLIQFTSVNSRGGLYIRLADQIEYDEDARDDPAYELAAASVGAHYLAAGEPVRCTDAPVHQLRVPP